MAQPLDGADDELGDNDAPKLTEEEGAAIRALKRLAKIWPPSLILVQHTDSPRCCVKFATDDVDADIANLPVIEHFSLTVTVCT